VIQFTAGILTGLGAMLAIVVLESCLRPPLAPPLEPTCVMVETDGAPR
jgi:hypothetical protein